MKIKHKDVGDELTKVEWEAEDTHVPADVLTPTEHSGITATPHVTDAEKTTWNGEIANVVEDTTPQLGGDLDAQNRIINLLKYIQPSAFSEVTIATGAITITQMCHTVDTEGDAATDDLETINCPTSPMFFALRAASDARTVVLKHNAGNIWLQGKADINLDDLEDGILLFYDGVKCFDIAAGGGGGATTFLGLTDTPDSYAGEAGKAVVVNQGETALIHGIYPLAYDEIPALTDWQTIDKWSEEYTGSGYCYDWGFLSMWEKTGTTVNSEAHLFTGRIPNYLCAKKGQRFWTRIQTETVPTACTFLVGCWAGGVTRPPSLTAKHIGFKIINGAIWATNADGTAEKATNTGATLTAAWERAELFAICTVDQSAVKYYVNGVLKATHTENIPPAGNGYFYFSVKSGNTTNYGILITALNIKVAPYAL